MVSATNTAAAVAGQAKNHLAGGDTPTWVWLGDLDNLLLSAKVLRCAALCQLPLLASWPGLNHKLQQRA